MIHGIICEGGTNGYSFVGAFEEIEKFQHLSTIRYFGGTNFGSIIALLFACGYTVTETESIVNNIKLNKLNKNEWWFRNVYRLIKRFGYYKNNYIKDFINTLLTNKFGIANITFQHLYSFTNKHLRFIGLNLVKGALEHIDHLNTPNMPVADGIQISMCVPLLCKPVKTNNTLYVGGGMFKDSNIHMFEDMLNVLVLDMYDNRTKSNESFDLSSYIKTLTTIVKEKSISCFLNSNIQVCKIHNTVLLDYCNLSITQKTYLKNLGKEAIHEFLEN